MTEERPTTVLVDVAVPVPLDQTFTYRWEPPAAAAEAGPARRAARRGAKARAAGAVEPAAAEAAPAPSPPAPPRRGDLVEVPFGRRRRVIGLVVGSRETDRPDQEADGHAIRAVSRVLPPAYALAPDRLALAEWLAGYYALPLGEVVPLFHPPAPGTRRREARAEGPAFPLRDADPADIVPTASQREAEAAALGHLERGEYGAILLHGITGSGKTEVYLRVIAAALARGRSAIFLLPEIALTPQTIARIAQRFGGEVAAIHSGLSAGERCRVHEAAAAGQLRVVVGPRSALFAPVRDLGVVVVDEEHETSYKQEETPRYHARHAALMRARLAGAVALLGSATPDLESYRNGSAGRYRLITLADRPVGELPAVEIVDMRGEPAPEGFSARLVERLDAALAAGRQAILYYNRRGFARALQCAACGEAAQCPACDIGLTYHLRPPRLLCHYCGHSRPAPQRCPACGSVQFLPAGGGTERVELGLAAQFPQARVLRLDQDSTRRRGDYNRILSGFAAGEADVLVGTQMVAKGHHFPEVELVGVLAADDGLTLPDFRADERAFQLLTQVAGRTGRVRPGHVIFQTYQPDHPIVQAAAAHDFAGFAARELELREALGYPPARRLLRVAVSGRRQADAEAVADELAVAFRNGLPADRCELLGPAPAVFARLQDRYRWQLLVKGSPTTAEKAWLAACARAAAARVRGVEVSLDVDPLGLY